MILAITIRQPFATLIVSGAKTIENRTWRTSYRGKLLIHAGSRLHDRAGEGDESLPRGAIIGSCTVVGCERVNNLPIGWHDSEHAEGPWCWLLADAIAFSKPIACSGAQGLWVPPNF